MIRCGSSGSYPWDSPARRAAVAWALDCRYAWATVSTSELRCDRCGASEPVTRHAASRALGEACERFLAEHRACGEAGR